MSLSDAQRRRIIRRAGWLGLWHGLTFRSWSCAEFRVWFMEQVDKENRRK